VSNPGGEQPAASGEIKATIVRRDGTVLVPTPDGKGWQEVKPKPEPEPEQQASTFMVLPDKYRYVREQRAALVRDDIAGHFRPQRYRLLDEMQKDRKTLQRSVLELLRDHVHPGIPRWYYNLVLGHDLHASMFARLFMKHWHANQPDPFNPDKIGWLENVGLVSCGKVTAAFVNFEALMLVTDATTIGDFKYHEAGTSATAEANTDTALVTSAISGSLAARVAGTQLNPTSPTYRSVGVLPATGTATWQEHGLFNAASGVTLMDRSLVSPTAPVVSGDSVTFTYDLTKTPEA
jgi:hypothetical protein